MAENFAGLEEGLRREQAMLLCRLMARAPLVNLIVVGFICYIVWEYVSPWGMMFWVGAVLTSEAVRALFARRTLAVPPEDVDGALSKLVWIALFVGCTRGSAMPLFFADLPPVAHAALSVSFLGFCAGGLSTHGPYARAFYVFAGPMLLALAIAWIGTGTKEGLVLAILFAMFAVMIAMFAREIEKLVRDSFLIRHQHDQLVEQLDQERQQVALARDVAERANNAKSRFLAAASHDLRQPLQALSLFSATLSMRAAGSDVREVTDHMAGALRAISALVDALLDISKLDARTIRAESRALDARPLVERVLAEYQAEAAHKGLDLRHAACDAVIHTDPVLASQMLRNLVDNSIKYTIRGHVLVSMQIEGQMLRISVEDSGVGIEEGERERIFEEFYQARNTERDRTKGLGLGLAIVRRTGKLLGTDVSVVSIPGQGSTFSFCLPLSEREAPAAEAESVALAAPQSLRDRSVLVIDDEPDVRIGMRRLLEAWGCRVLVCGGITEANRLLDEHAPELDLIVADFRLRAGESGIASIAQLRGRIGPVPALLVTGDTAPERLREAEASGLPILHKPVAADVLLQAMSTVMAGGGRGNRGRPGAINQAWPV